MSEPSGDFELSETDFDMIVEEVSGKPMKPVNLTAGIASMRQRIAQLEAEKTQLLDRMDGDADQALKDCLAAVNKDLTTARERLIHYEAQVKAQN